MVDGWIRDKGKGGLKDPLYITMSDQTDHSATVYLNIFLHPIPRISAEAFLAYLCLFGVLIDSARAVGYVYACLMVRADASWFIYLGSPIFVYKCPSTYADMDNYSDGVFLMFTYIHVHTGIGVLTYSRRA